MTMEIVEALRRRRNLTGWTVRHETSRGSQRYELADLTEAQREVDGERHRLEIFVPTETPDGTPAMGNASVTILPGDDVDDRIDRAIAMAQLVANPVHSLPSPAPIPQVDLLDPAIEKNPAGVLDEVADRLHDAASGHPEVKLTAAEASADLVTTHLLNSKGIDAEQIEGTLAYEFVLKCRRGDRETETFFETTRRRISDLHIEEEVARNARYALDLLDAAAPRAWQGAVVLRDEALATFMVGSSLSWGGIIQTMGSARSKYAETTPWQIGKPVFRGEAKGDPLTVWANRRIPFGITSDRFDGEGLPATRLQLIRDNRLTAFSASQRYADYLGFAPTGAFGGVELPRGQSSASDLVDEPYVEVVRFSWFNPDTVTGDFASEIRLGYLVERGRRFPFKGGQLVGNWLDAVADVRWSAETGFFGNYLGPITARFNDLTVTE